MCIFGTLVYSIPDDDLELTDNTVSAIDKADRRSEETVDDQVGLTARKRASVSYYEPSSLNKPVFGDLGSLVQSPISHARKLETKNSLSEKRAYMHDPFTSMSEQLETNANSLNTLTGDVKTLKSQLTEALITLTDHVQMMKTGFEAKHNDLKVITEKQNVNADTLDSLTEEVAVMKSEFISMKSELKTYIDEFKTIVEELKANADNSDDRFSDKFKTISETVNANSEKLDHLTNYVERALYSSCLGYRKAGYTRSGEYRIKMTYNKTVLTVYCDQETDGGGWLVFQRRQDGSEDFYRNWEDYKKGFGQITGEFWLGNDNLHLLTKDDQELRVDLMDFDGNTAYAKYTTFTVGPESENYKLTVTGYSGTAGNSLRWHNGKDFSTKDRDNDSSESHCAQVHKGAWWYSGCHHVNLNGIYHLSFKVDHAGVRWYDWKRNSESMKKAEMKIRPKT